MNTTIRLFTFLALTSFCHAQGSLTPPPGPPAPVMKSLTEIYDKTAAVETQNTAQNTQLANIQTTLGTVETQNTAQTTQLTDIQTTLGMVEARIPVNATTCPGSATATHVINQGGSYYLTGQVAALSGKSAIVINAAGVTLDMNGFSTNAAAGSAKGILVTASVGPIVIRNGLIRNPQQGGIQFTNVVEFTITDVTIAGAQGIGIDAPGSGTIERVVVAGAKDSGIVCSGRTAVRHCRVENITSTIAAASGIYAAYGRVSNTVVASISGVAGTYGIYSDKIDDCMVQGVSNGFGIYGTMITGNRVEGCSSGISIYTSGWTAVVSGNTVTGASNIGISADTVGNITNNTVSGYGFTSSTGIYVGTGTGTVRVEGNTVTHFATGIYAQGPTNLVIRNTSSANTTNFSINANMPVVAVGALGTNPNANIGQ